MFYITAAVLGFVWAMRERDTKQQPFVKGAFNGSYV